METMVKAPAKLNLFLDITGRRSDGYHFVDMVMQSVSLYDDVTVSIDEGTESIKIECSDPAIPCDETNTAYKAVKLFYEAIGQSVPAVRVNILKRIPSQAGMAGGSSDAAAVLKALNLLTKASLSDEELEKIAASIGADVPFCIKGGTVRATGIGTDLEELPPMPDCVFVIVKPEINISTGMAYRRSDEAGYGSPADISPVLDGLRSGDAGMVAKGLYNKFEDVLELPEVVSIKEQLISYGALGAAMTGSGSAVFGIFSADVRHRPAPLTDKQRNHKNTNTALLDELTQRLGAVTAFPEK